MFNIISANMNLRKREFAMLRSIGMTSKEFNRMVLLESFFYGRAVLVIGIPLGLAISYLLYGSRLHRPSPPFPRRWRTVRTRAKKDCRRRNQQLLSFFIPLFYRMPLVEGISFIISGSIFTAARSARATLLKTPSMI